MSMSSPDPRQVDVQVANTHLSALLTRVEAGEEIVLTRQGRPCARLVPIQAHPMRRLGFLNGTVDDACFESLPESELKAWEV